MPAAYAIDSAREIVLSRGWGVVTDRDLAEHARALASDARFQPHFRQLADLRQVTNVQVTGAGVRAMAHVAPFGLGARRAIVVSSDAAYGLARMFVTMRGDELDEIEVFRDLDAALEWLRVMDFKVELLEALAQAPPIPALE